MGVKPIIATKTVTTAGTRVQAITGNVYVTSMYFEALKTNTGNIYIGDSSVSSTLYMPALSPGVGFTLTVDSQARVGSASGGSEINASTIYVDAGVNGEKVQVTYLQRLGAF